MAAATSSEGVLLVDREELLACSLPRWYEKFKEFTFKSLFIPLTKEFVDYLLSDGGLVLPKECSLAPVDQSSDCSDDLDWVDEETENDNSLEEPSFPDLVLRISGGIQTLGGEVLPKLNWSAPKDAIWIAPGNTLKCTTPGEIILLLKTSQFISHDLTVVSENKCSSFNRERSLCYNTACEHNKLCNTGCGCVNQTVDKGCGNDERCVCVDNEMEFKHVLCLRKWRDVRSSCEFRCFVWEDRIAAISQRHCDDCYEHLSLESELIVQDITEFHLQKVARKFPIKSYAMDLIRPGNGIIELVDFNPFCPMTDSLLFTWTEIRELTDGPQSGVPVLKIVSDPAGIQPSSLHSYRVPRDFLDLSTGSDVHKLVDLLQSATHKHDAHVQLQNAALNDN